MAAGTTMAVQSGRPRSNRVSAAKAPGIVRDIEELERRGLVETYLDTEGTIRVRAIAAGGENG